MYKLSRLLLILATLTSLYCVGVAVALGWPASGFILVMVAILYIRRRGRGRLTTLGSARWAEDEDLRRAKMLDAKSGLILGRVSTSRPGIIGTVGKLFSWRVGAMEACQDFRVRFGSKRQQIVRLSNAIHTAVFSPSGGGKGVSLVVPFLMTCPESCVVVDFKGENAVLTANHRRKIFGHRIVLLDPFKVVTQTPDTFDPSTFIDKDDPTAIDQCMDLAKALVIRSPDEREPHWSDAAEAWIAALLATVVQFGDLGTNTRCLQTVRDFISNPQKLDMVIKLMIESEAWGGMLSRMGGQLTHFVEKEKSSTLTTVSRHLRFLNTLAVSESTKASNFDPAELRSGKMTIYLILPPDHMRAQAPLLRMWIGSLLRAVIRGGLQEKNKVHFILDEAASLGHLEAVDDAVDKYRGYGIRCQFYFQSMGQLKICFPNGQDQTLLSNTSQTYFAVNDMQTAEMVSSRLGEKTIVVDSGGNSRGTSHGWSNGPHHSVNDGRSGNTNSNWQQQTRKLLKPEEVIALPPRTAITYTPGVPPICTTLLRYYEEKGLGRRPHWIVRSWSACTMLGRAMILCLLSIALAMLLTSVIRQRDYRPMPRSPYRTPIVHRR